MLSGDLYFIVYPSKERKRKRKTDKGKQKKEYSSKAFYSVKRVYNFSLTFSTFAKCINKSFTKYFERIKRSEMLANKPLI